MKKLFIITNESIFENDGKFFCDNLDLKSTPEKLNKYFEVNLIGRKSLAERSHEIKINNIKLYSSIFLFIISIIKTTRIDQSNYLVVSISPYTFLASLFIRIFGKKSLVYLRSDGFKEYQAILGSFGPVIYYLMFQITSIVSNLVSCNENILMGKKGTIISPSQLSASWLSDIKEKEYEKNKLLYVGRIRVEKGIFSLIDLLKNKRDISLTIVGKEKNKNYKINQENVKIFEIQTDTKKLISFYDSCDIFILPSFTEGHPMALLESLARQRPVIVFEEIKHVITNKKGVFVSKRDSDSLVKTINYIKKNYKNIKNEMKYNILPTNLAFIKSLKKTIESLNG